MGEIQQRELYLATGINTLFISDAVLGEEGVGGGGVGAGGAWGGGGGVERLIFVLV